MSDISVLEIGTANQAAVITYEVQAVPALSANGSQETFRALVSNTWTVDGQGEWLLLVMNQQTPFDRKMAEDEAVGL